MNIVQENTGALEAVIRIELSKDDYEDRVSKELKSMQRKAQMPGFRPGKVPYGMMQKMYGKSVLVEEVNKVLADAIYAYIKDNKLNILGHPVADRQQSESLDWDKLDGFTFQYHIGLAPDIELELTPDITVDYHTIRVDDEMLNSYLLDIQKRYGKMTSPGVAEESDVLYGLFEEMETEEQLKHEGVDHKANLYIEYIRDGDVKARLIGCKPGDSVVFDILKAVESDTEAAAMVGLKKDELAAHSPLFRFTLESISRVEPAEMAPELYEKVLPGKGIREEDAFRESIRDQIGLQYQADVDKHFKNMVREKLIGITALPLPESFLKIWLVDANPEEVTHEQVDKEFDSLADTFRWQLIENHLIKTYQLEVTKQEIHDHLENYFRAQMKQYGQDDLEQSVIEGFIKNITSKEEEVKKVQEHLFEQKLLEVYKQHLSLNKIELSFNEFVELVTAKYKTNNEEEPPASESVVENE